MVEGRNQAVLTHAIHVSKATVWRQNQDCDAEPEVLLFCNAVL